MKTILIVDDEKMLLLALSRVFSARGFRALTAENGREALDTACREHLDVVLCDLKMPVMGAIEVLKELGATRPGLPVVVFTGHGTEKDAAECMEYGAYAFVTKPFQVDYLISVVKSALEKLPPPPRLQQLA